MSWQTTWERVRKIVVAAGEEDPGERAVYRQATSIFGKRAWIEVNEGEIRVLRRSNGLEIGRVGIPKRRQGFSLDYLRRLVDESDKEERESEHRQRAYEHLQRLTATYPSPLPAGMWAKLLTPPPDQPDRCVVNVTFTAPMTPAELKEVIDFWTTLRNRTEPSTMPTAYQHIEDDG